MQGFGQRSNVEVTLDLPEELGRLSTELEITLFRIVQESLTNVHRHSGSESASIRLRRSGPEVVLEVVPPGGLTPMGISGKVLYHAGKDQTGIKFMFREGGGSRRLRELVRRFKIF